jgi:sugar lactone lactonase YvrE
MGIAFDGTRVWASTSFADFQRFNTDGTLIDQIEIFVHGAHWGSHPLTSDGKRLWGHLPSGVVTSEGTTNISRIYEFSTNGVLTADYELDHRTAGLAFNGGEMWSLYAQTGQLNRIDPSGITVETIETTLPDPIDLEFDGTHFWVIGYYLKRLYQLDKNGNLLRMYDLPEKDTVDTPTGVTFDGTHFWYSMNHWTQSYTSGRIYKLSVVQP